MCALRVYVCLFVYHGTLYGSSVSTRQDFKTLAARTSVILCGGVWVVAVRGAESAVLEQHSYHSMSNYGTIQ